MRARLLLLVLAGLLWTGASTRAQGKEAPPAPPDSMAAQEPLVTFVELGSVKCIPCKAMQPVMRSIEKKYAGRVKVLFYDVWKEEQKHYAEKYGIRLIPTQVFLDKNGKEFFRHEGFYPEAEIDKLLRNKGVTTRPGA
jgi:thioredoxin 1